MKVFWAWQSDTPGKIGRFFVRDVLNAAIKQLRDDLEVVEPTEREVRDALELDHDRKGVPGSPDLARTILEKIKAASVFVADVTPVGTVSDDDKKLINSNVAIELGYALSFHTDRRLLMVMNTHYGTRADLPFDVAHKGGPIMFDVRPDADRRAVAEAAAELRGQLVEAIKLCIADHVDEQREVQPSDPNDDKIRAARKFAQEHHLARVKLIASGSRPAVALQSGAALVMHLVPDNAVRGDALFGFDKLADAPGQFLTIGQISVPDYRITYDGLLVGSNDRGLTVPQRAYVHVSRSGILEAVAGSIDRGRNDDIIVLPWLDATIVRYTRRYLVSLAQFGATWPITFAISLVDVKGKALLQWFDVHAVPEDIPSQKFDSDNPFFGEVVFGTVPKDDYETAQVVKPILTHLANAAGLASSPNFGANGDYILLT